MPHFPPAEYSETEENDAMTRFHDFTTLSNYSNSPLRAETLRIASTIDLDTITVVRGPPGGRGFPSGTWTVKYDGEIWKFFASVSHAAELDRQYAMVQHDAALYIAGVLANRARTPA